MVRMPAQLGLTSRHWIMEGATRTIASCVAYALAIVLNLEIANEYRNARWLRVAWLALAVNAGVSILRMLVESSLINLAVERYTGSPLFGLLQHLAIVPANVFLLLGLIAMWWAYHQVGLGFTIKPLDYAIIAGILVLMCALLIFREGLSQAHSPFFAGRYLQQIGLVLLALSAASSLVLQRMAMQMGGGKLAIALRFLTLYTLVRGVLVLFQAWQRTLASEMPLSSLPLFQLFLEFSWQVVPWIATLAAAYRAELTVHAAQELAQQRASKAALASA